MTKTYFSSIQATELGIRKSMRRDNGLSQVMAAVMLAACANARAEVTGTYPRGSVHHQFAPRPCRPKQQMQRDLSSRYGSCPLTTRSLSRATTQGDTHADIH
jgi:hypothetical protein